MNRLKLWAKEMKKQLTVLYFAAQHPNMPLALKLFALFIVSYALSPFDLIPDFIPVLGLLDDIILLPIGIYLCYRFTPAHIITEATAQAASENIGKKDSFLILIFIMVFWIVMLIAGGSFFMHVINKK
ncbi:DUF1232 domain-containing protein [Macrococcus hajekii]|uniref:DUF1232 domain-containing protein n=1 Tax=Macrococcus hajekii TaxID=198482 RepID=A0A4R6BJ27_9STAP|nr:DUF1232 domain-containing protein [Macrococcus hajekii]TDM01556.1 DUF1232 domain-containing protein [Macrococcus hajekii]GGB00962.1 hypothetical protein GCM10007190_06310 [Macrococcus hajekii]